MNSGLIYDPPSELQAGKKRRCKLGVSKTTGKCLKNKRSKKTSKSPKSARLRSARAKAQRMVMERSQKRAAHFMRLATPRKTASPAAYESYFS